MIIRYMLDTNMISYIVKGRSLAASDRLLALPEGEIAYISAITEAEIWYGLAKKPEATAVRSLMSSFWQVSKSLPGVATRQRPMAASGPSWKAEV